MEESTAASAQPYPKAVEFSMICVYNIDSVCMRPALGHSTTLPCYSHGLIETDEVSSRFQLHLVFFELLFLVGVLKATSISSIRVLCLRPVLQRHHKHLQSPEFTRI